MSDSAGRFLVAPDRLKPGRVDLGPDSARHMRVMRLRPGSRVVIFDGQGREAHAEVLVLDRGRVVVEAGALRQAAAGVGLDIHLVQALPVKLPRFDTIVRLGTELGVGRIRPVTSERGQLPSGGPEVLSRRGKRWRRIAETAAQQCGRSLVPEIDALCALRDLDWSRLPTPVWLLDREAGHPLAALERDPRPAALTLVVGPEGGLSEGERDGVLEAGAEAVTLGPRTLRADTAAAVALSVIQARWGDFT